MRKGGREGGKKGKEEEGMQGEEEKKTTREVRERRRETLGGAPSLLNSEASELNACKSLTLYDNQWLSPPLPFVGRRKAWHRTSSTPFCLIVSPVFSDIYDHLYFPLEEEMATHSSILAWEILWTEEPSGLYSPWGRKESDMTEATEH